MRTELYILQAVAHDGLEIICLSEAEKTPAVCMAAVQQNGEALEYVPYTLVTPEMCAAAVRQTTDANVFVPSELRPAVLDILLEGIEPRSREALLIVVQQYYYYATCKFGLVVTPYETDWECKPAPAGVEITPENGALVFNWADSPKFEKISKSVPVDNWDVLDIEEERREFAPDAPPATATTNPPPATGDYAAELLVAVRAIFPDAQAGTGSSNQIEFSQTSDWSVRVWELPDAENLTFRADRNKVTITYFSRE